jgi:hypothetical protein
MLGPFAEAAEHHFVSDVAPHCGSVDPTHSSNEALGILVERSILWERKFLVNHPHVHVRMIVHPERRLKAREGH